MAAEPNTEAGADVPNEDDPNDGAATFDPKADGFAAPNAEGVDVEPKADGVAVAPNADGVELAPNADGVDVVPNAEGVDVAPNAEGVEVDPNAEAGAAEPNADVVVDAPKADGACVPNAEGLDCDPNADAGVLVEPNAEPVLPKVLLDPKADWLGAAPNAEAEPARGEEPNVDGEPKALC